MTVTAPISSAASDVPVLDFAAPDLLARLDAADAAALDQLDFGVIRMDADGIVLAYNSFESRLAGLSPGTVIGRHFFTEVAPCTNNYMVAGRFETTTDLDHSLDYVFSARIRPNPVRLRLLKPASGAQQYLLVERR